MPDINREWYIFMMTIFRLRIIFFSESSPQQICFPRWGNRLNGRLRLILLEPQSSFPNLMAESHDPQRNQESPCLFSEGSFCPHVCETPSSCPCFCIGTMTITTVHPPMWPFLNVDRLALDISKKWSKCSGPMCSLSRHRETMEGLRSWGMKKF